MKKVNYIIGFFLLTVIGYFVQTNLPYWWSGVALAAIIGMFLGHRSWGSFWMGFVGLFLLWAGVAHYIDYYNHGMLSNQIGNTFGDFSGIALALITGVVGGILGGLGAMTGSLGRRLFTTTTTTET